MKDSHENTFDGQNESDPLIEDLEVTLTSLREELHVSAENAGSIVGPVVLTDDGYRVDCARLGKGGYSVHSSGEPECIQIRFFFQAEDGIRDYTVTGVQTCALPI